MEIIKQLIIDFMAYISNTNEPEDVIKRLGKQYSDKYKAMGIANADSIFNGGMEFIMAYQSFPNCAALMDNKLLGICTKQSLMEGYTKILSEMLGNLSYILENVNTLVQNKDMIKEKVTRQGICLKVTGSFAGDFLEELVKNNG